MKLICTHRISREQHCNLLVTYITERMRVGIDPRGVTQRLHEEADANDHGVALEALPPDSLDQQQKAEQDRDDEEGDVQGDIWPIVPVRQLKRTRLQRASVAACLTLSQRCPEQTVDNHGVARPRGPRRGRRRRRGAVHNRYGERLWE